MSMHSFHVRRLCRVWALLTLITSVSLVFAAQTSKSTMVIRYPEHESVLEEVHAYQHDLIKLILEQTKDEYGDYLLSPKLIEELAVKRQALLVSQGYQLNLIWNSPGSVVDIADATPIQTDIFQGLLGYRICLINRNNSPDFSAVVDIASLKFMRIGQAFGWTDFGIYKFNQVDLIQGPTLEGLLGMLASNRFDCLPLGAGEIAEIYRSKLVKMPMLAIEPTLLIYYDFPTYFYISNKHPQLIARFQKGMAKIEKNGDLMRLFDRHYKAKLVPLNIPTRRIICLRSPYLPVTTNQCKHPQAILNRFSH